MQQTWLPERETKVHRKESKTLVGKSECQSAQEKEAFLQLWSQRQRSRRQPVLDRQSPRRRQQSRLQFKPLELKPALLPEPKPACNC